MVDVNDNSNKILLLGLPEAGKTSFLAAFSFSLEGDAPETMLKEYRLSSNTSYITSIKQTWLKGEPQERTKVTATLNPKTEADIFVENNKGTRFTLHVPDFFGETFENQFIDRHLEINYIHHLKSAVGILLFIHPQKIKSPILIEDMIDAHDVEDKINQDNENQESSDDSDISTKISEEADPFLVEECPTQVVLVDLLEAHLEYCLNGKLKLSTIISAWDTVKSDNVEISPARWLEISLPFLSQYLQTNSERLEVRLFGVSAQGGDLDDKNDVLHLTGLDNPIDRIIVQEGDTKHKNISAPIEWILD